jgi:uncharacterized protein
MMYHLEEKNKMEKLKQIFTLISIFLVTVFGSFAQDDIPDAPNPPRLYNNLSAEYSDLLSPDQARELEAKLVNFAEQTSNQVVVVVVDDLSGYEPWEYCAKLGDKWKVGQEKEDNGIIILIKPTGGKGERKTFIATGRGLEGAIPDYTCNEIVENELLPNFKNGEFYKGITESLDVLLALAKGEYDSDEYAKKNKKDNIWIVLGVLFVIFILVAIFGRKGGGGGGGGSSFGGGSSGGGFGGFGGGSFGGGGSGGSW